MRTLLLVLSLLAPIEAVDHAVQGWVQAHRTPLLETPMNTATRIGTPIVVLSALLAVALVVPAEGVPLGRVAVVALAPTNLVVEVTKYFAWRTRPDGDRNRRNSSFPSSHSANAFCLAAILARRWRRWAVPIWFAAAVIAASRTYLNRHFASDVLAGLLLGVVCAAWSMRWFRWPRASRGVART